MAAVQCGKVVEEGCAAVRVEPLDEGLGEVCYQAGCGGGLNHCQEEG